MRLAELTLRTASNIRIQGSLCSASASEKNKRFCHDDSSCRNRNEKSRLSRRSRLRQQPQDHSTTRHSVHNAPLHQPQADGQAPEE